jgi:hypothetical protein
MATSHPHAVRAMERAIGVVCSAAATTTPIADASLAACGIPNGQGQSMRICESAPDEVCTMDTRFFVERREVDGLRAAMASRTLGALGEGDEYLALTFRQ